MIDFEILERLSREPRHFFGGDGPSNYIGGLVDLLDVAKPDSVLEIGSYRGISTECFLLHCRRVVAVDPWPESYIWREFNERCGSYPHLEIIRGRSPAALATFKDGEFDMVYIDGDHDRRSTAADIVAAKRITKGFIAGHDYVQDAVRSVVQVEFGPVLQFSDSSWLCQWPPP